MSYKKNQLPSCTANQTITVDKLNFKNIQITLGTYSRFYGGTKLSKTYHYQEA